ncbi:MAG: DUF1266 domain-containing protein [Bacteroidota bacterium]
MFSNLPWYTYVILLFAAAAYAYRYYSKFKQGYNAPDLKGAKFKSSSDSALNKERLFALAFYTPISEWWGAQTNTLSFLNKEKVTPYLKGWGISEETGYWDLTNYFMKDGRRWYFNFIYDMVRHQPEASWDELMDEKFGGNERADRYLASLKGKKALNFLKQKGFISFDSELELGVAGYDAAVLVGQARKAFTAEIITEAEAWKVIAFARELALKHFSSWEEFGKSFILGFELDMRDSYQEYKDEVFHLYKQVLENDNSPWKTITWP